MCKLLVFLFASFTSVCLLGYKHTIKLDQDLKNTPGSYEIILDGSPETSFTLIVGKDQTITAANVRGVEVHVTPAQNIELVNTTASGVCLRTLTVLDSSKKLLSDSIRAQPFRTSASGPSYCGDYTFGLTITHKKKLQFKDKTDIK